MENFKTQISEKDYKKYKQIVYNCSFFKTINDGLNQRKYVALVEGYLQSNGLNYKISLETDIDRNNILCVEIPIKSINDLVINWTDDDDFNEKIIEKIIKEWGDKLNLIEFNHSFFNANNALNGDILTDFATEIKRNYNDGDDLDLSSDLNFYCETKTHRMQNVIQMTTKEEPYYYWDSEYNYYKPCNKNEYKKQEKNIENDIERNEMLKYTAEICSKEHDIFRINDDMRIMYIPTKFFEERKKTKKLNDFIDFDIILNTEDFDFFNKYEKNLVGEKAAEFQGQRALTFTLNKNSNFVCVLMNEQGTGKSLYCNVLSYIDCGEKATECSNEDVKFNSHLYTGKSRVIEFCESSKHNSNEGLARDKKNARNGFIEIEQKNKQAQLIKNNFYTIRPTNKLNKIDDKDRAVFYGKGDAILDDNYNFSEYLEVYIKKYDNWDKNLHLFANKYLQYMMFKYYKKENNYYSSNPYLNIPEELRRGGGFECELMQVIEFVKYSNNLGVWNNVSYWVDVFVKFKIYSNISNLTSGKILQINEQLENIGYNFETAKARANKKVCRIVEVQ